ncbi:hypothetical protein B566_EDAN016980 [Ephemera danica]|nr:hypothetical protein B566_EDAN016980 [Ephemera danica]
MVTSGQIEHDAVAESKEGLVLYKFFYFKLGSMTGELKASHNQHRIGMHSKELHQAERYLHATYATDLISQKPHFYYINVTFMGMSRDPLVVKSAARYGGHISTHVQVRCREVLILVHFVRRATAPSQIEGNTSGTFMGQIVDPFFVSCYNLQPNDSDAWLRSEGTAASSKPYKFSCNQCSNFYTTYGGYRYHMRNNHGVDKGAWVKFDHPVKPLIHSCNQCSNEYASRDGLYKHMRNIHGQDQGPFICQICQASLKNKRTMIFHLRSIHKTKFDVV